MSLIHTSLEQTQPETLRCKRCNADLPPSATFCGHCGERVEKQNGDKSSPKHADITSRYRITSLLRKQLPTQILLARDNQQQRPVVIHEIDINNLDDSTRIQAIAAVKSEYDLLRKQRIPGVMPLIDLYYFNQHLSLIASWPFSLSTDKEGTPNSAHYELSTLQDLLQSGLGLPDVQIAIGWIYRLSAALEQLHHINIVLGDLDPQTILMSQHNYQSEPLLVGSWLPTMLRALFPPAQKQTNPSSFYAPETLLGNTGPRSDIYSLGAILYLLLTGITPSNAHKRLHHPLPSLHELNLHHNESLDMVLMQALALEQEQRYQSMSDFMDALQQFLPATKEAVQRQSISIPHTDSNKTIQIASNSVDTTNSDGREKPIATTSAEENTGSVVPLQARMARRYLSRIKTGKLDLSEQSSGEAIVETKSTQQDLQDEQSIQDELMEKTPVDTDFDPPRRSERDIPENNMDTIVAEHAQDLQNTEESPVLQLPVSDIQMAEKLSESGSVELAKQRQPTLDPHMETSSTKQAATPVEDIAQISTVVITSHELETALAAHAREEAQLGSAQDIPAAEPAEEQAHKHENTDNALNHFKEIFTGSFPSIPRMNRSKNQPAVEETGANAHKRAERANDLLKRVQHFILGEPQQTTSAAALIETPMRIQPNQGYTIRINVIGRNNLHTNGDDITGGLSSLVQGDEVHIEVRSALYQNYAYIVQQADVAIPATGFVAEVTMPMKPLSSGPSGRRERLHIFFMDDNHNPLYEKPFVIEVFISHLVQNGREGHNVLSIPL